MKRLMFAVIMVIGAATGVVAADDKKAEKAAYQQDLEKTKREQPGEYVKLQRLFTFITENLLARLGYDVAPFDGLLDDKAVAAIKAYEKGRGLAITGDPLTFETMEKVAGDTKRLDDEPVSLPMLNMSLGLWDSGYVSAEGTWTIAGEEMAWPEQTSNIVCDRSNGTCVEATAIVSKAAGSSPGLSVDIDTYEIERWDEFEIVTKPLQLGCTRYVRRISRPQKSVTGIRSTTSSIDRCKGLDNAEKFLKLEDGLKVWKELSRRQREARRELVKLDAALAKLLEEP